MSTGLTTTDRETIDDYCSQHGLGRRARKTLIREIARSHAGAAAVLGARDTTRQLIADRDAQAAGTIIIEGAVRGRLYEGTDPEQAARVLRQDHADCASLGGGCYSDACPDLGQATEEQCRAFHAAAFG